MLQLYDPVEGPHVEKVEQLREQLYCEGSVDAAPPQQRHGVGENREYLWRGGAEDVKEGV